MMKTLRYLLAVVALACGSAAEAQVTFPTAISGVRASGAVVMQCSAAFDNCMPATATNPQAVNNVDISATGSLAALNAASALTLNGNAGFAVDIRGTFTGTITFQGTVDGTNWIALAVVPVGSTSSIPSVTTTAAAGAWVGNSAGLIQVRAVMTAYTSGTATAVLRAMQSPGLVMNYPVGATSQQVQAINNVNLIGDVGIQYRANATGAASAVSILSPATPAGALMKSGAGRLIGCFLTNTAAALRSVKFYNATAVTMGTTAAVFEIDLPQNAYGTFNLPGGIGFATGIMTATTSAKGLTDNTATGLVANDVSGTCWFL